jgi:hypothetical protein
VSAESLWGWRGRASQGFWFAVVCAATLLGYLRSFASPFQLDDYTYIVGNPVLESPSFNSVVAFGRTRIIPFATLILNHHIDAGDPFGYHVVNFVIHLLVTFAVYRLAMVLCRTPRVQQTWMATQALPLAVAAAFVFACHPIQIQAVTYIVQRMSSMVALFYVGSILLYVRARNAQLGLQRGRPALAFAGAALLALAAFLSKENSASLPLVILLTEWTFYPGKGVGKRILRFAPFLVLTLVIPLTWYLFGTMRVKAPSGDAPLLEHARYLFNLMTFRANPRGASSSLEYFWTQCVVIPRYLGLVILPWGFNIDHDVPVAHDVSAPVAAGLTLLVALLGFGLFAARRWPLVGFGIVWVFLALSVESSFLPIQDVMVEHRMYLAMPGVAMVAGAIFAQALRSWRTSALLGAATVATLLCVLTFMRNELWREPISLWQDAAAKSPKKARVYANVGTALHHAGRLDEAIQYYCLALALDPKSRTAEANAYKAVGEKMREEVANDPTLLEGLPIGSDGTVEMDIPDPCAPAARKK